MKQLFFDLKKDLVDNLNEIFNVNLDSKTKCFEKGYILQRQGDLSTLSYFVKKGLLRSFTIDEKGKEHVFMFAPEGWIIADIESQEFDRPAELYIECLEDSEVVIIDRSLFKLPDLDKGQLKTQINLMSRRIGTLQRRLIMMMSAPAVKRYEYFLKTYPDLPNRIPQKMIAAYLGITPEALSSLRGKLARSK